VCLFVCSLSYLACNAHAPYCIFLCDLYDFKIFVTIVSLTARFSGGGGGGGSKLNIKRVFRNFQLPFSDISHSKKNTAPYCYKCT